MWDDVKMFVNREKFTKSIYPLDNQIMRLNNLLYLNKQIIIFNKKKNKKQNMKQLEMIFSEQILSGPFLYQCDILISITQNVE